MCGIVAVVRRRSARNAPSVDDIVAPLEEVAALLAKSASLENLEQASAILRRVDLLLRGEAGLRALLSHQTLHGRIVATVEAAKSSVKKIEDVLAQEGSAVVNLEAMNASLIEVKDGLWAIERDRLRAAKEVTELAGVALQGNESAIPWLFSLQQTLSNVDRLEVRGRDSAGIHILVTGVDATQYEDVVASRAKDALFGSGSVRISDGNLGFVYKAASEIGELGDNTAAMRSAIASDALLQEVLNIESAQATVLAHTRWASIGIISEPNAHPVNSEEVTDAKQGPYVTAVLNGDVDNFTDLISSHSLCIPNEITTDAKVIPTMLSRGLGQGLDPLDAMRSAVSQFEGSVAIGVSAASSPRDIMLALRGSGQGVYIGLAEDAFVVASEPYGVVEDSTRYLRMDGETPSDAANPTGSQGQIIGLTGDFAGDHSGLIRLSYDGQILEVAEEEWKTPEVTTRDIDRGDAPHFLLKEISEAPQSFEKTLRGRLVESQEGLTVSLPAETFSDDVVEALESGRIKRIDVIGQGTAAVAGQAIAASIAEVLVDSKAADIAVRAITATELSGFGTRDDMSDTFVVAVSQSGTTTDTNRTVDILRARGAVVVAIVNRRGSDLVDKSDGVLYTSDGRDVEMSVASTKAFYSQIAAGFLLADAIAMKVAGTYDGRQELLQGLRDLPEALRQTLQTRPAIAAAAEKHTLSRRYWAMVGSGKNTIAAKELRIKLSELCYKAIACDVTEDKKHIDLSSEPLILVCAAGLTGSNADDIAKEVAIFKAHKSAPIVIATEGENRFSAALDVIAVPQAHESLAFILSTMVGHLFGYEAALAIDASARPLREARGSIENYVGSEGSAWFKDFAAEVKPFAAQFFDLLRAGSYNGHLEAATAYKAAALLRYATRVIQLESYQVEFGKVGTPGVVVEDLAMALTAAIEELTRPIDAIKHQAKTVTVGISRADESLLQSDLTRAVLETGCPRDRLSYRSLRTLAAVAPAVISVNGYTRYRLEGDVKESAQLFVVDKSGVAAGLSSRVEKDPTLRGTKHRVAVERMPIVTVGTDGRVVLIIPEVKDKETTGLTLCHLSLEENLSASAARSVLQGYRNRYRQLLDVVTEKSPTFREDLLANVSTVDLLTAPISEVAAHWE